MSELVRRLQGREGAPGFKLEGDRRLLEEGFACLLSSGLVKPSVDGGLLLLLLFLLNRSSSALTVSCNLQIIFACSAMMASPMAMSRASGEAEDMTGG